MKTIDLASLPPIGKSLDGGIFAGLTTKPDSTHCAVVLLPGGGTDLTWAKAKAWAKKQGGELPSRPVAALLFANVKASLQPRWHWTSEEFDASSAWRCYFGSGLQLLNHKSYEGSAVAVRRITLAASPEVPARKPLARALVAANFADQGLERKAA